VHPRFPMALSADHSSTVPDYVLDIPSDAVPDPSSSTMAPAQHGTRLQHGIRK
jgi:hypothetical protein